MKIRVGFIGLGVMGRSHVHSIRTLCSDHAEVMALCAGSDANIEKALEEAPGAKVFKKDDDLIASPLDAIFVSTPNFLHAQLAEKVLAAGKHLFLEKPIGISREECYRVLEAAERSNRIVMVGHELRYSPYFQRMKDLVAAGEIGQPRMVWTREFRGPFQKKSGDWVQDQRKSGGCLVEKNCHHFDLMNWWVGSRPKRVAAFGGCATSRVMEGPDQINDHATVSFEYENGVRGALGVCMFALDFPAEDLEMGVIGDAGMLLTRISRIEILHWKRGTHQKEPIVHRVNAKHGEGWGSHLGFDEIHHAFINCILENKPALTNPLDCLDGTLLGVAAEESIKRCAMVDVG